MADKIARLNHHVNGINPCPLCADKLKEAHPYFLKFYHDLKNDFPKSHISWTWRDRDTQNQMYNDGRSKCLWPGSSHNFMKDNKPCSRAIDLFVLSEEGIAQWPTPFFLKVAKWSFDNGFKIKAGVIAPGFSETCHFQLLDDIL